MSFEISDEENAAIDRSIKAGEINDSDTPIIEEFMNRLSSHKDFPTIDNITEEQKTQITEEVIKLSTQYGIEIQTNDNGDVIFKLPNGKIKTHNINNISTSSEKQISTPSKKQISTSSKKPAFRGGNRTKKDRRVRHVGGGAVMNTLEAIGRGIFMLLVCTHRIYKNPLIIIILPLVMYSVYQQYKKKDDVAVVPVESSTIIKPKFGDIYIANKDYHENRPAYPQYDKDDILTITGVPSNYTNNTTPVMASVYNQKTKQKVGGFFELINFDRQKESVGGNKNRKSRSKTRKQKRRRTKK
jgi:hypothetical protein